MGIFISIARLRESGYSVVLQHHSLIIVEAFKDVIILDVPAVSIMSSRMTEQQGEKIIHFAELPGINRVSLMFDCDAAGTEEACWFLAERQVEVRLV